MANTVAAGAIGDEGDDLPAKGTLSAETSEPLEDGHPARRAEGRSSAEVYR